MAMSDFTIIRRSMLGRFFSTSVTILMVAVSVGLMLVLLTLRESSKSAFERGTGNMHMVVAAQASPLDVVLNSVFHARPPRNSLPWEKYQQIAQQYRLNLGNAFAIPVQQGDSFRGFPVVATSRDFFEKFQPVEGDAWEFAAGEAFDDNFEIVIGAEVARAIGIHMGDELALAHGISESGGVIVHAHDDARAHDDHKDHGDDAHEDHERNDHDQHPDDDAGHMHDEFMFAVVGILEQTGGPHDRALFIPLESAWILHAHDRREREAHVETTTADDLLPGDRLITGIYLRVLTREGSQMAGSQQQVFSALRADPTITVADPSREIENLFKIIGNIDDLLLAMAAVVMLSSAIAIMLALYNSMEQRRRQIAVLRVLGCSKGRVFGLIVTESALIGMLGAAAGVVLAWLGALAAAEVIAARLRLVIEPVLPIDWVLTIVVATVLLASLAGIVPAMMGYRTPVARNLKPMG